MTQTEFLTFDPGRPEGKTLLHWWRELQGQPIDPAAEADPPGAHPAPAKQPNYRGERADLRRCAELADVVLTPAYQRLFYQLRNLPGLRAPHEERLATVAGVLARVKDPTAEGGGTFARQLGQQRSDGGPPLVSELRFRRLLRARTQAELYPMLGRLLGLLDGKAELFSLAQGAYGWGDGQRKRWAYHYYDAVFRQGGAGAIVD